MGATAIPPNQHRVALEGFTTFERNALESSFALAAGRHVQYVKADEIAGARFVIADADHPGIVAGIVAAHRVGDTIFVGAQAPDGAMAWTMRPIDPLHVIRQLDAAVAMRDAAGADVPLQPPHAPHFGARPGTSEPAPARRASDSPVPPRAAGNGGTPGPAGGCGP